MTKFKLNDFVVIFRYEYKLSCPYYTCDFYNSNTGRCILKFELYFHKKYTGIDYNRPDVCVLRFDTEKEALANLVISNIING